MTSAPVSRLARRAALATLLTRMSMRPKTARTSARPGRPRRTHRRSAGAPPRGSCASCPATARNPSASRPTEHDPRPRGVVQGPGHGRPYSSGHAGCEPDRAPSSGLVDTARQRRSAPASGIGAPKSLLSLCLLGIRDRARTLPFHDEERYCAGRMGMAVSAGARRRIEGAHPRDHDWGHAGVPERTGGAGCRSRSGEGRGGPSIDLVRQAATTPTENTTSGRLRLGDVDGSSSASGTFTVPTLTCTAATKGIAIVEVGDPSDDFTISGVEAVCLDGAASYTAAIVLNGTETHYFTVDPGDTVTAQIKETTASTSVTLDDTTLGVSKKSTTATGQAMDLVSFADNSVEYGSKLVGTPKFTTNTFSKSLVDGKALSLSEPTAYELEFKSTLEAVPGSLSASGQVFKVKHV